MSHIIVDLGGTSAGPALIALGPRKRRRKVKSALIVAQQTKSYIPWHCTDRNHVKTMLQALGGFPNLTVLTLDLSYWKLRVATLSVMLQATRSLKELALRNLVLTGNLCDQNELEHVLASHSNIQSLKLDRCQGTATVRTLLTKTCSLRKVKICSSRISQSDVWASVTLVEMCAGNPKLKSLSLIDVLDLEDHHVCQLVQSLRTKSSPNLRELCLVSSNAGRVAGEAICSLVGNSDNSNSFFKLTLALGGNWNNRATSVTPLVLTLRKLQLQITGSEEDIGNDFASVALHISNTLSCRTARLTQLDLAMDLNDVTDGVVQAFENALKSNNTLEDLRFCDAMGGSNCSSEAFGSVDETKLTPFLRMKLDLNRSGLLRLLHASHDQSIPMDSYLKAMTRANENLSVLFYALSNNPALFLGREPPSFHNNVAHLRLADSKPPGKERSRPSASPRLASHRRPSIGRMPSRVAGANRQGY